MVCFRDICINTLHKGDNDDDDDDDEDDKNNNKLPGFAEFMLLYSRRRQL